MDGLSMRYGDLISDLDDDEKMAYLAILLMDGTLSSREYVEGIRSIYPHAGRPLILTIARNTDWALVNRIASNMDDWLN